MLLLSLQNIYHDHHLSRDDSTVKEPKVHTGYFVFDDDRSY